MAEDGLSAAERSLYVRQIMLAEVGASGQRRLLAAEFHAPDSRPGDIAASYLERSGLRRAPARDDVLNVMDNSCEATGAPDEDALRGAFEAVEIIKRVLGVGRPGQLQAAPLAPPPAPTTEAEES